LNDDGVKLSLDQKHVEAIEKYNLAISESEGDNEKLPIWLSNRACSLVILEKIDEAIADCVRALTLDPKCVMALIPHSKAYAYKGDIGRATDILRKALELEKDNKGL